MRHRSRRIAASKQSRYLRDVSRAVEALVLSAWYPMSMVQLSSHLQVSPPALRCSSDGEAALSAPVLAEMLEVVSCWSRYSFSLRHARCESALSLQPEREVQKWLTVKWRTLKEEETESGGTVGEPRC